MTGPIFLRWGRKTFRVEHEDIVGFCVYESENIVGQKWLSVGLMRRDGSLARMDEWHEYDVEVS